MKKLDKKSNLYFFITRTVLSLFIFIPLVIIAVIDTNQYPDPMVKTGLLIGLGILSILCAIPSFITPWFVYRMYGYEIKEDYLIIHTGVIYRRHQMIPIKRIQHIEKLQNPIQLIFKQATVSISTAGVAGLIQGLSFLDAEQILLDIKGHVDYHLKQLGDKVDE